MSSKSSSSSSSKSFIARCSKHHVSSRIVYIHIDFSHEIVSNSLSLSHQKERDQISRRKKKTLKKQLREREKNRKTQQTLFFFFSVLSYRHDVSFALVHEFDRHAHAFAVETDVVAHDFKKERKRGGQFCPTFSPSFFLSYFFFMYGLGFVFI